MSIRVGILALQGNFTCHAESFASLGVPAALVRSREEIEGLTHLVIPGGESTTIGKLSDTFELTGPLRAFAVDNPVWGTCAGMIFMAKEIGMDQPLLGMMDIVVERNAFGRQVDSFEVDLDIPQLNNGRPTPFPAVFIRAPRLVSADKEAGVEILARLEDGTAVAARQGHWLVTSFHPELTNDPRFHQYFLHLIEEK